MTKERLVPLMISQVVLTPQLLTISITHFKHNQKMKPVDIPITPHSIKEICPLHNLANYLSLRGYQQGPLFCFPSLTPINRQFFSNHLSRLINFSGFQGERYKAHSLRIGGASYYAGLGYTDAQIRLLGRWDSNAFVRYIRSNRVLFK